MSTRRAWDRSISPEREHGKPPLQRHRWDDDSDVEDEPAHGLVGDSSDQESVAGSVNSDEGSVDGFGAPPSDDEVQDRLSEAAMGIIDLDHTLAVVRYYGGFPTGTRIIEVEPEDEAFGLGFTDTVEATVPEVLALVRSEL